MTSINEKKPLKYTFVNNLSTLHRQIYYGCICMLFFSFFFFFCLHIYAQFQLILKILFNVIYIFFIHLI